MTLETGQPRPGFRRACHYVMNWLMCRWGKLFLVRRKSWLCLALAAVLAQGGFTAPLRAAEPGKGSVSAWKKHKQNGEKAKREGRFAEVEEHFKAALAEAEGFSKSNGYRLAESLQDLGVYYLDIEDDAAKAEPLLRRGVEVLGQQYRASSPEVAQGLVRLTRACVGVKKLDEAKQHATRVRAITVQHQGAFGQGVAVSDFLIGEIHAAKGEWAEAEAAYEKALKTFETSRSFAVGIGGPFLNDSQVIYERTNPYFGGVAHCLNSLVQARTRLGKITEAESDYRRMLKTIEKQFAKVPGALTGTLVDFGRWCLAQKKYADAQSLLQRAIDIETKNGTPNPQAHKYIHIALAGAHHGQGNFAEADKYLATAINAERALYQKAPPTDSHVLYAWCKRLHQVNPDLAGQIVGTALAVKQSVLEENRELANWFHAAGALNHDLKKWEPAEKYLTRALSIREKALGVDHPASADVLEMLASARIEAKDQSAAEALLRRAIAAHGKASNVDYPNLVSAIDLLITLAKSSNKNDALPALYQQRLDAKEKQLGPDHIEVAQSIEQLADLCLAQERFKEAEPLCERMVAIEIKQRGLKNFTVLAPLGKLATVYRKLGKDAELVEVLKKQMAVVEDTFGPKHKALLASLDEYAQVQRRLKHDPEAAEAEARAKAIRAAEGQ
ncbi:MAG: tetratricopeptide repeat protein [Verrucomicrobiota bacterium]